MSSDNDNYSLFDDSDADPNYSSNSTSTLSSSEDSEEELPADGPSILQLQNLLNEIDGTENKIVKKVKNENQIQKHGKK